MTVGTARSTIDLAPIDTASMSAPTSDAVIDDSDVDSEASREAAVLKIGHPIRLMLGEASYRRSEESWVDAGEPTAEIELANESDDLVIEVSVTNVDRSFVALDATNRLDNEHADVNGAGIQLYLRGDDATAGYVLVPRSPGDAVAIRPIDGWGAGIPVSATWTDTHDGYVVEIHVAGLTNGTVVDIDVIVNEMPMGRERRRGQLVLSGARRRIRLSSRGSSRRRAPRFLFVVTDA